MTTSLLSDILDTFKTHCNAPELIAEVMMWPGEVWIMILALQPTAAMHELACTLENEFDELGLSVPIEVRRPDRGLWGWLAGSVRRMFGVATIT